MSEYSRKRKTQDPCQECFLHKERCICSEMPHLSLNTKVTLIIHAKELKRTTNTGRLALKILANSEMRVRGLDHSPLDLSDLISPEYRTLMYFPSEDAVELTEALIKESSLPIHLIVPDGNWRQASKVHYRHQELAGVQRVKISSPNMAEYHMRAENTECGMATLEAIAHAMGMIEGERAKNQLLTFYERKLFETLKGRGKIF